MGERRNLMGMKVGYLEVVEVKKIRSRAVCQLIVEADISQFKKLVMLDEQTGVFIPCKIEGAVCGAFDLDIEPDEIQALMGQTMKQVAPPPEEEKKDKKEKSLAQKMMLDGYFRLKVLWEAMEVNEVYTQDEHKEWIEAQEGLWLYPLVECTGDVVGHHVRTAENSGKGMKPPHWYLLPLNNSQHQYLHNKETREEREEHLVRAVKLTEGRMRERFKEMLGIDSMSGFTVKRLAQAEHDLGITTPFLREYLQAQEGTDGQTNHGDNPASTEKTV
jgi:hypothetical protein